MRKIHIFENGFDFKIEINDDGKIALIGFSRLPFPIDNKAFKDFKDSGNQKGRLIEVTVSDDDSETMIITHFQFIKNSCNVEIWSTVINQQTQTESLPKLFSSVKNQA